MGNAHYALGRWSAAIACYDDALSINSDKQEAFYKALYNKALCHGFLGDVTESVEALRRAISLYPQCRYMAKTNTDFDPIRHDERFRALLEE